MVSGKRKHAQQSSATRRSAYTFSVCVCRERRGLQTSALFHGSEKQLLFSCNSLLFKRRERRPTHMKAYPSFSPTLAAQIVGCKSSPLANRESENFYFAFVRRSSSATPTIPPPCPKSSPPPLALTFPFFFFFLFALFFLYVVC